MPLPARSTWYGRTANRGCPLVRGEREILRSIERKEQFGHASELWTSWDVLAKIEEAVGKSSAAAQANRNAINCYLDYRRAGGENHYDDGRVCLEVTQRLLAADSAAAVSFLAELAARPDLPGGARAFVEVLQTIVAGSRDRKLADDPDFHYTMAAEILFLIETLEKAR